jgi:hypothetical protein
MDIGFYLIEYRKGHWKLEYTEDSHSSAISVSPEQAKKLIVIFQEAKKEAGF